jgi:hypothetical protein
MAQHDQEAREVARAGPYSPGSPSWTQLQRVDAYNLGRLKHVIVQDGFPTVALVGHDGVDAAWLLAQHADSDPDLQATVLAALNKKGVPSDLDLGRIAMLTDRVLIHQGKKQRYGTQFEQRDGELQPMPIEDAAHVDERRRSVGLGLLQDYTCVIHAVYETDALSRQSESQRSPQDPPDVSPHNLD